MPNDLKNDLDTKDSINNTFISNQLSKTNNIELLKALENGFKLIDLSDDEINIIINSIQNNEIKKSYIKKVENMLNNNKKMSLNKLQLSIVASERNKEIILETLLENNSFFSIVMNENDATFIEDNVLNSNLKFYCNSFIKEQENILEKKIFVDSDYKKTLIIYSDRFSKKVTELKLKYPSEIFLRVNDDNYESSIKKVLEIDESNLRGEIINKFINNRQIEHTPRIRQDIGKIYFLLDYDQGKSIAPLLKSYVVGIKIFSTSEIFHNADNIRDLADFEEILMPVSKDFILKTGNQKYDRLKQGIEKLVLSDFITIEKIYQNNLFKNDILLNTGLNSVSKNKCLTRDMGMWKIDLSEVIGRS
ncbi:MAG: hypothetical protein NT01SARS_0157 [SAR86 cluster bacterium SAR86A]|uniref:Uncharacterized protein n=1 Tax=SAR86 cluster bacterium SAR86A TaxID=1123866 RepID=J5K708_9GAMM|nr:MAG: hypothetical protein NT01SARS_0157 [SAR86 cluster bacterium SAR86A]